jgi:hypothetical protein
VTLTGVEAAGPPRGVPAYPVPAGCTPTPLPQVPANVDVCVHDLLVTRTRASAEQNSSSFDATDGAGHTLSGTVPKWWPSGGPVAGMVVTLWGERVGGTFHTSHWVDWNHGSGPSPAGPYPRRRLLDVAAGKYPALEMAWVIAVPFALDPQNPPSGDGDIHVQTALPCPAAGLTFETTPRVRGYVDHPGASTTLSSTNQSDAASLHTADAPPVGVPVMMLGQLRFDFGFGWWEVHPVRAWRPLTAAEASQLASECANAPMPVLDSSAPTGDLPYGFPPCTDGSEVGNPGGIYQPCGPHCYVATTAIGEPQTTAGHCAGVTDASTGGFSGATPAPGSSGSPWVVGASGGPVPGAGGQLPSTSAPPWATILTGALLVSLVLGLALFLSGRGQAGPPFRKLRR